MEKLDQYLDRVCRCIDGPWPMRQHVRQELREHLLDAVAKHQAAGLSAEQALDRALEEFGKPEDLHSELVATHGQRVMAVVIDRAMQWKEMTMRAKWLWLVWAHLALVLVLALELFSIWFLIIFIVPKFHKLLHDGAIDRAILDHPDVSWMPHFVNRFANAFGNLPAWYLLVPLVAWGLFEWRVKSENKSLMRLSALGTAAVILLVVVVLAAGSLIISFCLGAPATSQIARQLAVEQIANIDTTVTGIEQALEKKDWAVMQRKADQATHSLSELTKAAPVLSAELKAEVKAASDAFAEVQQAIRAQDAKQVETMLQGFRKAYGPILKLARP